MPLSHTKSKEKLCGDSQAGTKPQEGSSSEIEGFGRKHWETTKTKGSLAHERQDKHDTENQAAVTAQPLQVSISSMTVEKAVKNTKAVEAKKKEGKKKKNETKNLFPLTAK